MTKPLLEKMYLKPVYTFTLLYAPEDLKEELKNELDEVSIVSLNQTWLALRFKKQQELFYFS